MRVLRRLRAARPLALHRDRQVVARSDAGQRRHPGGGVALPRGIGRATPAKATHGSAIPGRAAAPLRMAARGAADARAAARRAPQAPSRLLEQDFYGALGLAEGLMANKEGISPRRSAGLLNRARELMPADVDKPYRAKFFSLRGMLRLQAGDQRGAIQRSRNCACRLAGSAKSRSRDSRGPVQRGGRRRRLARLE